jgi:hypothetical protein
MEKGMGETGETVSLNRTLTGWKLGGWDAVWSDCGSADENTFPPYPEGF